MVTSMPYMTTPELNVQFPTSAPNRGESKQRRLEMPAATVAEVASAIILEQEASEDEQAAVARH